MSTPATKTATAIAAETSTTGDDDDNYLTTVEETPGVKELFIVAAAIAFNKMVFTDDSVNLLSKTQEEPITTMTTRDQGRVAEVHQRAQRDNLARREAEVHRRSQRDDSVRREATRKQNALVRRLVTRRTSQ